ncbi:MAG TPA: hypothetical protein VFV93_04560 [Thermomicrobiales bacterium]|nr:hypothetical protein [Thermomicrobiales bacterium]
MTLAHLVRHEQNERGEILGIGPQEPLMETKQRSGWMTVMIALSLLVAAVFVLYLIMTLAGILD